MKVMDSYVVNFSCANRPGIVAAASTALFQSGCNILDAQQFDDLDTQRFFGRIVFNLTKSNEKFDVGARLSNAFKPFAMEWSLRPTSQRRRVMLLASRWDHCLADLIYRWRIGELAMDVTGVVSNYPAETYSHLDLSLVPFHYLPVTPATKQAQEAEIWQLVQQSKTELVVLARYMQVLSNELCTRLAGRCINIHHSFLPGFKGAKPYQQAHTRGVKLIGATAHYVTADLDEGPIIEQDVERISHRDRPEDLVRKGRDIERRVLARAVRAHLEDRVFLNGSKTIVFPD
ncbi:MAG: formyltetrahydrofolate deformylase [Acetobacteraceae bacterium]|nr:formyltetrahydrofolate deformylase [Acetobacteraceae bacterium]